MRKHALKRAVLAGGGGALWLFLASGSALANPINTTTALTVNSNPITAGVFAEFTATVTAVGQLAGSPATEHPAVEAGTPIVGSDVELQWWQADGVPAPEGTPGTDLDLTNDGWKDTGITGVSVADGTVLLQFNTTAYGGYTIGFRAHTFPQGGNHAPGVSFSGSIDLVINSADCTGVGIGATLVDGDGNPIPGTYSWTFGIEVHNCDLSTRTFKVQGGSNGWAPMTGVDIDDGAFTFRENRRNQVITWTVELEPGETRYIDVTVAGTIGANTPDGTTLYLSGPWSAAYIDDTGNPAKSNYTGRVSIEVSNP